MFTVRKWMMGVSLLAVLSATGGCSGKVQSAGLTGATPHATVTPSGLPGGTTTDGGAPAPGNAAIPFPPERSASAGPSYYLSGSAAQQSSLGAIPQGSDMLLQTDPNGTE